MLSANRLPKALVVATFALSGALAVTGASAVAVGVGDGSAAPCPHLPKAKPAHGILHCLEPSTAYISSPIGSGSGLVIDGGYILTNEHVVDPFPTVDVTIGSQKLKDVKVVGADLYSDIAVLGPVKTDAPTVHLADAARVAGLTQGDPLYLVGYPGEANDKDLQATIAGGILSRTRHSDEFGLHYLQSDASIGGGQSGGALVDDQGYVVGITSAKLDDSYALALSSGDAATSVRRILAGKGDGYTSWPAGTPAATGTVSVTSMDRPGLFILPAAATSRTVDLTVPTDLPIVIESADLETDDSQVAGNVAALAAEQLGVPLSAVGPVGLDQLHKVLPEDIDLAQEVRPGTYRWTVPAGRHELFVVSSGRDASIQVPITSSIPGVAVGFGEPQHLSLGADVRSVTAALPFNLYDVHLTKGQQVRIHVSAPAGDMWVDVFGPGLSADGKSYDDSRTGVYGVDVDETFTAPADGTYELHVGTNGDNSVGYHFTLTEPTPAQRNK